MRNGYPIVESLWLLPVFPGMVSLDFARLTHWTICWTSLAQNTQSFVLTTLGLRRGEACGNEYICCYHVVSWYYVYYDFRSWYWSGYCWWQSWLPSAQIGSSIAHTIACTGWMDVSAISVPLFDLTEVLFRSDHKLTLFFSDFEVWEHSDSGTIIFTVRRLFSFYQWYWWVCYYYVCPYHELSIHVPRPQQWATSPFLHYLW